MRTEEEMLQKLAGCCAAKECCLQELRQKLERADLPEEAIERVLSALLEGRFVDEARYARAFVNDKFRFNKWGRLKINQELARKGIPSELRREALEGIDETAYGETLLALLREKARLTKARDGRELGQKLFRFAASRGFESGPILDALREMRQTEGEDGLDPTDPE